MGDLEVAELVEAEGGLGSVGYWKGSSCYSCCCNLVEVEHKMMVLLVMVDFEVDKQ